eukprot:Phypoly_transcript_02436.p1 GENE.Phypoly_transcript_02436~~Phypoly_transcript_02436.p1  ORF type:complete len:410 (+),score=87.91 Phypoly_transcript_02436:1514-2743(+)
MIPTSSKRGSISKESKRLKSKKQKTNNKRQESPHPANNPDFNFDHHVQQPLDQDDDGGEGIFVIDDPDAYYLQEYNSDEERRKRTAQKQERENEQLRMEEGLKKKKKKRHANVTAKKYYQVPTDATGNPIMPIEMRGLTIHSLGKIVVDRKKFHAKRYIWPAGFKSSRIYCSMTNLNARCEYTSEIVDGDSEPRFIVTCYEDPKNPIVIEANTASGAWAQVGKRINDLKEELTGKRMFTQLSGPEMFGFSHPTIAKLIQELPNAEMCDRYIFQEYVPSNVSLPTATKKGKRSKKKNESEEEDGLLYDEDEYEEDEEEDESEDGSDDEEEEERVERGDRGERGERRRDFYQEESRRSEGSVQGNGYGQSGGSNTGGVIGGAKIISDSRDVSKPINDDWEEEEEEESGTLH